MECGATTESECVKKIRSSEIFSFFVVVGTLDPPMTWQNSAAEVLPCYRLPLLLAAVTETDRREVSYRTVSYLQQLMRQVQILDHGLWTMDRGYSTYEARDTPLFLGSLFALFTFE